MSGNQPRHKLVIPADRECSTCTADCPACAELYGNQPEKGAMQPDPGKHTRSVPATRATPEAVTGVAPRCTVCQSDRCRLNDGTYGACTYVLCPDPLADWCEERKTSIEAARNRMRAAPAPQPMPECTMCCKPVLEPAQPMSAEAWLKCFKADVFTREDVLKMLPLFAANQHSTLQELIAALEKTNLLGAERRKELEREQSALIAERDRLKGLLDKQIIATADVVLEADEAALRRLQGGDWVSVKEPPKPDGNICKWALVWSRQHGNCIAAYRFITKWWCDESGAGMDDITHWRELPAPPTAEPAKEGK